MTTSDLSQVYTYFETLLGDQATVLSIQPDNKSFKNDCFIVKTSAGKFLLKLAPADQDGSFANVVSTTHLLVEAGVRVPKIIAFDHGNEVLGRPFVVQEWLEGQDAEDVLPTVDDAQKRQLLVAFGRTVAKFHTIKSPGFFGAVDERKRFATWEEFLVSNLKHRMQQNEKVGLVSSDLLQRVHDDLTPRLNHLYEGAPCLTHLDLHLPNVLLLENGEIGLIDFEYTKYGDPYRDFVKLHMFVFPLDSRYETWFLEGYCEQKPLDKDAEERIRVYQIMEYLAGIPFFVKNQPELAARCVEDLKRAVQVS